MNSFQIWQGDRLPWLPFTLERPDGSMMPRAGVLGVRFRFKGQGTELAALPAMEAPCVLTDALFLVGRFEWSAEHTATAGLFLGFFVVDTAQGTHTVPGDRPVRITIAPKPF